MSGDEGVSFVSCIAAIFILWSCRNCVISAFEFWIPSVLNCRIVCVLL